MLLTTHPNVPIGQFKIGDYLTDGDRLYRVEHIAPSGEFTLENCQTSYTFGASKDYMRKLNLSLVRKGGEEYE